MAEQGELQHVHVLCQCVEHSTSSFLVSLLITALIDKNIQTPFTIWSSNLRGVSRALESAQIVQSKAHIESELTECIVSASRRQPRLREAGPHLVRVRRRRRKRRPRHD